MLNTLVCSFRRLPHVCLYLYICTYDFCRKGMKMYLSFLLWLPWKWTDLPAHTKPSYHHPLGNLPQSTHSRVTTPGPLSPTPKALCPLGVPHGTLTASGFPQQLCHLGNTRLF